MADGQEPVGPTGPSSEMTRETRAFVIVTLLMILFVIVVAGAMQGSPHNKDCLTQLVSTSTPTQFCAELYMTEGPRK